jgi:hypothetical protein
LEILLEYGFQNETDRSLDHPISNGRYSQASRLSPVFGYFHLTAGQWSVALPLQLSAQGVKEHLSSCGLDLLECHSVHARRTFIPLGKPVRLFQYVELPHMSVEAPETMAGVSLRLLPYPLS